MKLKSILEELTLELNVPKPEDAYDFYKETETNLGYGIMYEYVYVNNKGDAMEVTNMVTKHPKEPGKSIYIAFGPHDPNAKSPEDQDLPPDEEEEKKYKTLTGAGDMIKVLATVVEAIRLTMEKVGGSEKVYAIKYNPSDVKRKNIYDYYITSLFPDFEKVTGQEGGFITFANKNFKEKKVNEIGGESEKMKPYPFKNVQDDEEFRTYIFKTDSGLDYQVELDEIEDEEYGMVLNINFGVVDEEELTGPIQNLVTNKGELYRVMNTIAAVIREDLAINQYIKYITFNPAKRDKDVDSNARGKLYMKYIQGRIPNAKEVQSKRFPILIKIK